MRRTILLALFAALLLVPTTTAHAQGTEDILRDCADDGMLAEDYSASAMRNARDDMPAELDEYSDCRDVLSRAISAKTAGSSSNNSSGGSTGGGGAGGGGGTGDAGGSAGGGSTLTPTTPEPEPTPSGRDPGIQVGPSTPQDYEALRGANRLSTDSIPVNGRPISPAAAVGRNGLPGTVVATLALLAAAALAVTVPFIRRRVVTRTTPT